MQINFTSPHVTAFLYICSLTLSGGEMCLSEMLDNFDQGHCLLQQYTFQCSEKLNKSLKKYLGVNQNLIHSNGMFLFCAACNTSILYLGIWQCSKKIKWIIKYRQLTMLERSSFKLCEFVLVRFYCTVGSSGALR